MLTFFFAFLIWYYVEYFRRILLELDFDTWGSLMLIFQEKIRFSTACSFLVPGPEDTIFQFFCHVIFKFATKSLQFTQKFINCSNFKLSMRHIQQFSHKSSFLVVVKFFHGKTLGGVQWIFDYMQLTTYKWIFLALSFSFLSTI